MMQALSRGNMRRTIPLLLALGLVACSKPSPPQGRWEGGYSANGTIVAGRVEIGADGQVRISAPDITNLQSAKPEQLQQERERLAADLASGWDGVAPRPLDFDGKTFRKPGGVAPQMVWDKASNQMTLELYIGANPALPVPLRPVDSFHDNPWPSG
jgi:hypothetical protein